MQSGFDGKYWTCSIREDSVCLVIICHGDLLPWRCCDITIILFHHGVDSLPFLTTSPRFNRLSQNGSNDYNETSTEWSDSSLRNEKTIKKNFFWTKKTRHEHDPKSNKLRDCFWFLWGTQLADTLGRLRFRLAFFHFSLFFSFSTWSNTQFSGFGFRRWPKIHEVNPGHHTLFEISFLYSLFFFFIVLTSSRKYRCNGAHRTLRKKKKKRSYYSLYPFLSILSTFDLLFSRPLRSCECE